MSQINKPNEYFNTITYTGTGATGNSQTVGFQPDFIWFKNRSTADDNALFDSVRGRTKILRSNVDGAELTGTTDLESFDSNGFTVGVPNQVSSPNRSGSSIVAWNWLGGGTASSNTDGSITSQVSASTTSGFSIVSYTGNSTSGATVGHGLGVTPNVIIVKTLSAGNFNMYHSSLGATQYMLLTTTAAATTASTRWNDTAPDSSVFTLGNAADVNTGSNYIAYCFAEKKGFSKFGSYTGNGSTDGTFVYTGFKPAFVMTKSSSTGGTYYDWGMMDNKRANPFNVIDAQVAANLSDEENSANIGSQKIDFLSNGFKPRVNGSSHNASGVTYIYMAFAENPLVGTNNIPATAR